MSISKAIQELERAYHELKSLFSCDMPLPIITIQSSGRKRAKAWCSPDIWVDANNDTKCEINICAEFLKDGPIECVHSLLHEMCHYNNNLNGIDDCNAAQYHNKHFKHKCDEIGLITTKGKLGYAETALSKPLLERIQAIGIDASPFTFFRGVKPKVIVANRQLKWSCGCEKGNVRTSIVEFRATCNVCEKQFKCTDKNYGETDEC